MAEFDADYQALRWVAVPLILVATTFMLLDSKKQNPEVSRGLYGKGFLWLSIHSSPAPNSLL